MTSLRKYIEDMISTSNFPTPNFVGTIRKIKINKDGKMVYRYAPSMMKTNAGGTFNPIIKKNPNGSFSQGKTEEDKKEDKILFGIQRRPTEEQLHTVARSKGKYHKRGKK